MQISEIHRCPCGEWHETPGWLRWLGRPSYRRALYAWPHIGGGWDGWEYAAFISQDRKDAAE